MKLRSGDEVIEVDIAADDVGRGTMSTRAEPHAWATEIASRPRVEVPGRAADVGSDAQPRDQAAGFGFAPRALLGERESVQERDQDDARR